MNEPLKGTMKKIDLRPYRLESGAEYDIKGSFRELLFHPKQELTVPESFENAELFTKMKAAGEFVLVDSGEYRRIMRAYNAMTAPGPDDLEFFARIRDAVEVPVEEVPDKDKAPG